MPSNTPQSIHVAFQKWTVSPIVAKHMTPNVNPVPNVLIYGSVAFRLSRIGDQERVFWNCFAV
jgi:hypothetical protein